MTNHDILVTVERDIATPPDKSCFEKVELLDERTLAITYRMDKVNAGQGFAALSDAGSPSSTSRPARRISRTCFSI